MFWDLLAKCDTDSVLASLKLWKPLTRRGLGPLKDSVRLRQLKKHFKGRIETRELLGGTKENNITPDEGFY